jgi:hypothetical protein
MLAMPRKRAILNEPLRKPIMKITLINNISIWFALIVSIIVSSLNQEETGPVFAAATSILMVQ